MLAVHGISRGGACKQPCSPSTGPKARKKGGVCKIQHVLPETSFSLLSATAATLLLATPAAAASEHLSQHSRILYSADASVASSTSAVYSPVARLATMETAPPLSDLSGIERRQHGRVSENHPHASTSHPFDSIPGRLQLPLASLLESLSQPLPYYVYGVEAGAATVAAVAIWMWQGRPVGWVQPGMLEVRPSQTAGLGLFTRVPVPSGTVLGSYPGRIRSGSEMAAKVESAPDAAGYVFNTGDGRFIDPTDESGMPSPFPGPGSPWPFPVKMLLPYANEPPKGAGGTNCFVETGPAGPTELIFQANRDIEAGEEIFIDYGLMYDRASYGRS
ncbi:hypothetical protein DUNSADRAFT_1478 [Dunaliella salina]|uniref:SET domain-containing protein n=1 Tax=Dunaliella salina TaxID=3046 RepID=A0ABQ7FXH2_DUNSA|nr:hypothetical protein DUNSADRAFT_1478 [Dunaliella salina]|eukprot:KAF5827033.1 hypothetical protein DUNSADRAFT_1478 [Dunaliella salina]